MSVELKPINVIIFLWLIDDIKILFLVDGNQVKCLFDLDHIHGLVDGNG